MATEEAPQHLLVPQHELTTDQEREELMQKYSARPEDFPKIMITDPAIKDLGVKEGDIIKILRSSTTAGDAYFYRIVVSE